MANYLAHTLQDSFEYEGMWWLPDSPENELPGKLSFDPEKGARLSLLGSLDDSPFPVGEPFHCGVINGITANGVKCTLMDNYQVGWHYSSLGMRTQSLVANLLILGECLIDYEQLRFSSCRVTYDHLEEWITPNAFDFELINGVETKGYSVRASSRKFFDEFITAANLKLSLSNFLSGSDLYTATSITLRSEAFLKLVPTNPLHFEEFRKLVTDLGRLLAILIGNNTWPQKVQFIFPMGDESDDHSPPVTVSTFYRLTTTSMIRKLHRHSMTVDFPTFVSHLSVIVERWLSCSPGLQSVKYLFFTAQYNESINLENRFLNLVHALESYHRAVFGGKYISQDEYEAFRAVIEKGFPKGLPDDLENALRSRLKYGNEYALRKRLTLLLKSLDKKLLAIITSLPMTQFVDQIVDTRNYYVHYDEESKDKAMTIDEMFYARPRLALFVRILLLRTLGFDDEQIYQMVHDKPALLPWD